MFTTEEFDGTVNNMKDFYFHAIVEAEWTAVDNGIGYYEYGEGKYNDVNWQWELAGADIISFSIIHKDREIFEGNMINANEATTMEWYKLIEPIVDTFLDDLEPPDEPAYEEPEYYDPDGTY